jgi:hypothetical protein
MQIFTTAVLMAMTIAPAAMSQDSLPLEIYPNELAAIRQAAGFEVPVTPQWERLAVPGQAAKYSDPEFFTAVFFTPLIDALKGVGSDAMGQAALKTKLKGIVLTYDPATAPASHYPNGLTFVDGVLTINFTPYSNTADVKPRADAIQAFLESKL